MDFEQTLMLGLNLLVCTKWSKLTHIMFAAEIFYWYWKISFSGKIGQNWAVFCL